MSRNEIRLLDKAVYFASQVRGYLPAAPGPGGGELELLVGGGAGEDQVEVGAHGGAGAKVGRGIPPLASLRRGGGLWGLFVFGGRDEGGEEVHKCGQVISWRRIN